MQPIKFHQPCVEEKRQNKMFEIMKFYKPNPWNDTIGSLLETENAFFKIRFEKSFVLKWFSGSLKNIW